MPLKRRARQGDTIHLSAPGTVTLERLGRSTATLVIESEGEVQHSEDLRTCQQCGKPFKATRSDARYCSGACRVRALRSR